MLLFQNVASEPEKVFGGQTEVAWLRREGRDTLTKVFSEQGDDSMKRVLLCLVAGAGLFLPVAAQAKDCCKPVKVKCCKPVKVKCCQKAAPTCCQAKTACCTSGAATAAPAPAAAAPAPAKKPYEEPAAPPPPAEKKAEEKKK